MIWWGSIIAKDLANSMVRNSDMYSDWELSYTLNLYKEKGDSLERESYRGLKLLDHVMKIMERIIESIIRKRVEIDNKQFGFMRERGATKTQFPLSGNCKINT